MFGREEIIPIEKHFSFELIAFKFLEGIVCVIKYKCMCLM